MRYVTLGRKLGRGTRQAAERVQNQVHKQAESVARQQAPAYLAQGRVVVKEGRRASQSFWKRLAHAGRMLWHEVTGVFFALFALFFAQGVWRTRAAWHQGAEHQHFVLYLAMAALFAYFSVSSFVRSRRRSS
ncbi:MAG TPA: hypothetical protein VMU62_09825 [Acidobacteriaceae bacterium]|nr:hypothetical protein [Acidobacteriaceae bacterium]